MPIIDMAVDFDDIKDLDAYPVLPTATYDVQVVSIESDVTGENSKTPGRPKLVWSFRVINNPDHPNHRLSNHNTVLPFRDESKPPGEELVTSGCGFLVSLCKALGKPWTGRQITTEEYIGLTCKAIVVEEKMKFGARQGDPTNVIKNFGPA